MANPNPPFTGFPYGISSPGLGMMAMTPPLALPQTTTHTIFTLAGGPVRVMDLFGIVTTAVGAVANATKLSAVITTPAGTVDLCGTADLNAAAAGTFFVCITGASTGASIASTNGIFPTANTIVPYTFILTPGTVIVNCAGSDGGAGRVQWYMRFQPLSVGVSQAGLAQVTAALS